MIFTFVAAIPFFQWASATGISTPPMDDPFQNLRDIFYHMRWVLASMGLYAASILWSVVTSMSILAEAKKNEDRQGGAPPIIR
jgi:uncharacterized membrane protein (DUF106 family)